MQIVIGLLTAPDGDPVAVRVFEGNTADPTTCLDQIKILADKLGVKNVTLVGDRGMIKSCQIKELQAREFHYITAVTKPQIESLVKTGVIQLDLFDEEITEVSDGEVRYILRRNPLRAKEIAKSHPDKYRAFRAKVEAANDDLKEHPKASADIQLRDLTAYAAKRKILTWLKLALDGRRVDVSQDEELLASEAKLDGCYVIKTDLPADVADAETVHARYKDLTKVENAFRTMKTECLEVRPVYVRKENRTRGHVFITMLAYKVIWEIERCLPDRKDIPIGETIAKLSRIGLTRVELGEHRLYRVQTPDLANRKLLKQLSVVIPKCIPGFGMEVL